MEWRPYSLCLPSRALRHKHPKDPWFPLWYAYRRSRPKVPSHHNYIVTTDRICQIPVNRAGSSYRTFRLHVPGTSIILRFGITAPHWIAMLQSSWSHKLNTKICWVLSGTRAIRCAWQSQWIWKSTPSFCFSRGSPWWESHRLWERGITGSYSFGIMFFSASFRVGAQSVNWFTVASGATHEWCIGSNTSFCGKN